MRVIKAKVVAGFKNKFAQLYELEVWLEGYNLDEKGKVEQVSYHSLLEKAGGQKGWNFKKVNNFLSTSEGLDWLNEALKAQKIRMCPVHKIYVDGAYKSGKCGIGVYLRNGLNIDDEFSAKIKASTSMEGELRAIEFGLMRAIKLGFTNVEVYNDCQEAVDRINEDRLSEYFSFTII